MWIAFKNDTALSDSQIDLIRTQYNQVKDLPLHLSLVARSIALLEKQENRSLFLLFDQGFKEFGPLYPLVLIYALYPKVVSLYSRLGISDQVRQATLADIAIWVKTYEEQHSGASGLDRYGWICRHLCAKVIRLGRLQFEQSLFKFPYSIHYDTKLLRFRTFAQDTVEFSFLGYGAGKAGMTTHTITKELLIAHEVDQSQGSISREAVSVSLGDLSLICKEGSPVISVHIPEGEPLTPSLVDESFSMALARFNPTLFVCDSWLLDPELLKVLPRDSNIVHFTQRFLKFPVAFTTPQIYERVFGFGVTKADILGWECTTSLQRKVQEHILDGGVFQTMGGFIPMQMH